MRIVFDGEECLSEYKRLLRSAEHSIWICMYMIRFDESTKEIWDILRKKHSRGVDVRVWYDVMGCARSVPRLAASPFCHAFIPKWHRLGTRNHAKVIIVDDEEAVVSGRNFTKRYYGEWVDASVFLTEKGVLKEMMDFRERIEQHKHPRDVLERHSSLKVTDPLSGQRNVYNFVLENIVKSTKQITIASPYFVIDDAIENLLRAAMDRGVEVTVIVPRKPEHRLAATFNRINFQRIHHKHLHIKRSEGMFHSKVMMFDDVALVGSANFDNRSFKHNLEASVVCGSDKAAQIKRHLHEVADHSVRYNWVQRQYDTLLYHMFRHFNDLL